MTVATMSTLVTTAQLDVVTTTSIQPLQPFAQLQPLQEFASHKTQGIALMAPLAALPFVTGIKTVLCQRHRADCVLAALTMATVVTTTMNEVAIQP